MTRAHVTRQFATRGLQRAHACSKAGGADLLPYFCACAVVADMLGTQRPCWNSHMALDVGPGTVHVPAPARGARVCGGSTTLPSQRISTHSP